MNLYRVQNVNCPLDHDEAYVKARVAKELGVRPQILAYYLVERRSVDARDKRDVRLVYTVLAGLESPSRSLGAKAKAAEPFVPYSFPTPRARERPGDPRRPVVVGSGPAGLFCALMLAEAGYRPVVLERGDPVEARGPAVSSFWAGGELDPESNMQFGEGGAGTYSDGKLTYSGDGEGGRSRRVLEELVKAGAPAAILSDYKPHVGTDFLVPVVRALRERIDSLGGELRFRSRVDGLRLEGGRVSGVVLDGGAEMDADRVVLAVGHSARDTFRSLARAGVPMERKPFAVGLRVEHPQEMISRAQYGERWDHRALGAADYKLTHRAADGRGVYSFCMCPGGYVVDASSEPGHSACNGMSDYSRSAPNANSAIVVAVRPDDYGGDDSSPDGVLAGVEFQRIWERRAWEIARATMGTIGGAGASAVPVQALGDFIEGRRSDCLGAVVPSIRGAYALADLNACLPPFAAAGIKEAFRVFNGKLRGFGRSDAVLSGVETRTSSPVRVLRDGSFQSSVRGLFPCGEGAGYAGGIMSAAVDGIKAAEAVAASLSG